MTAGTGDTYDVVIIGGGAAGLNAAVVLGRARRTVLVIDAGEQRNLPAEGVHGFLTREGMPPAELVRVGRAEALSYGAEIREARATDARRDDGGFVVTLDGAGAVRGRRLLVTTGLVDELPDVPGVRERWGRDVLHCPYCHGWEVRDQALGVLATGPMAVHQTLLFGQWSADITLFLHTAPAPSAEQAEQLAARGVRVVEGTVTSLRVEDDGVTGVELADGTVVPVQAVVVGPRMVARSGILTSLGLPVVEHPMGGEHVESGERGVTAVPGVWVAGNVTDLSSQVITSAAGGLGAAAAINADLVTEDLAAAVTAHRARSGAPAVR